MQIEIEKAIDVLIKYHKAKEAKAAAFDHSHAAEWHKQVAYWLQEKGKRVIEEGIKNEIGH